ncbi:hypothetical protein DDZ14_15305 [Maritimibacter sp. 55A14]|uniref:TadE/TadG family type IV pilus assembly protein n=1 Tax=Maritimibacter sp. 55A14 TaxID=2174844 RepID=UPI000D6167B5|nr:Tad domain-containing protein [Maritimibacter sp. 55A14]PWE30522.1 hypothetical protein DDZ14_15305 [Maritimibacter sp. 55A14]
MTWYGKFNAGISGGAPRSRATPASFAADQGGSLTIFTFYAMVIMLFVGGMAYDIMRFEAERVRTQAAMDRSVLAAASLTQVLPAQDVVESYFEVAGLDKTSVTVSEDGDGITSSVVNISSETRVPTRFLRLMDYSLTMGAFGKRFENSKGVFELASGMAAGATENIPQLEISLVLDASGSMGWNQRLKNMQAAAKEFSWHMLCDPGSDLNSNGNCSVTPGLVSISLVPFSEQVNAGPYLLDGIDDPNLTSYDITDEHDYSHCLNFTEADFNTTNLAASTDINRTGHFDPWNTYSTTVGNWACRTETWRYIRPFVAHHSNLNYLINNLRAGGNTSIDIGMKWGTALLDPELRDMISDLSEVARVGGAPAVEPDFPENRPLDFDDPEAVKIVVLMSDGENTTQHELKPDFRSGPSEFWKSVEADNDNTDKDGDFYVVYNAGRDQYYYPEYGGYADSPYYRRICNGGCNFEERPDQVSQMSYPALWAEVNTDYFEDFSFLPRVWDGHGNWEKNQRLNAVCTQAKQAGIIVFTVGFEAPNNGRTALRNCASSINHYYDAEGRSISDAFNNIALAINNLRLTQ